MTLPWMVYALIAATLIAAAAYALDVGARLLRISRRWIWLAALGATVVLVVVAPVRARRALPAAAPTPDALLLFPRGADDGVLPPTPAGLSPSVTFAERVNAVRASVQAALLSPLTFIERRATGSVDAWLLALWIASSLSVLALVGVIQLRFHRARRSWPLSEMNGIPVRIAPNSGPAVIGLYPAEIVVPRWLTLRSIDEQRLVLAHECEHVRAGDPFALVAAWVAVVLLPWNPAVWWMAARIRLAVELDCDMRLLRQGVRPSRYGALLIDLAAECAGLGAGAAAFSDQPTQLERRLRAITPSIGRFSGARAAALGMLALVAIGAACETQMPAAARDRTVDTTHALASAAVSPDSAAAGWFARHATAMHTIGRSGRGADTTRVATVIDYILNGSRVSAERALAPGPNDTLEERSFQCTSSTTSKPASASLPGSCELSADTEVSPHRFAIPLPPQNGTLSYLKATGTVVDSCASVSEACVEMGSQDTTIDYFIGVAAPDSTGRIDIARFSHILAVVESSWVATPSQQLAASHGPPVYMVDSVIVTEASARALFQSAHSNLDRVELFPPAQVIDLKWSSDPNATANGLVYITTKHQ